MTNRTIRSSELSTGYGEDFVGREGAIAHLVLRCECGGLTSIIGPAGMGKTRLARELGVRMTEQGVAFAFCDLSEALDADALCHVVAATLGVALSNRGELEDRAKRLAEAIAARGKMVIALDNFEQLVQPAWQIVKTLRDLAPACSIVITSRQRVRLSGEHILELEPLSLPTSANARIGSIAEAEAVQLLVRRAHAVGAPLCLEDPSTAKAAARIVLRLDGIPLAIELSAARLRHSGLETLAGELETSLADLGTDDRDAPDRARTLHGAIAWSWDLLTESEQKVFAQCSAFRGGFSMRAAEAVIGPSLAAQNGTMDADPRTLGQAVRSFLGALVDKSLVRRSWPEGAAREPRFSLLAGLREFAKERFDAANDQSETLNRHGEYYLQFAESLDLASDAQHRILALEADNLYVAAEHALATAKRHSASGQRALRFVLALESVALLSNVSRLAVFAKLAESAIAASAGDEDAGPKRAWCAMARAYAEIAQGRFAEALFELHEASSIADNVEEASAFVEAASTKAMLLAQAGLDELAESAFEQARSRLADTHVARARGTYHYAASQAAVWRGDAQFAEASARQAVTHLAEVEAYRTALARGHWAVALMNLGRLHEANEQASLSVHSLETMGERRAQAYSLGTLGRILSAQGDHDGAKERLDEALAIHAEAGEIWSEAFHLQLRAMVFVEMGQLDKAEEDLRVVAAKVGPLARDAKEMGLSDGLGRRYFALSQARLGAVLALLSRPREAALAMQRAFDHTSKTAPPPCRATIEIANLIVERAALNEVADREQFDSILGARIREACGDEPGDSELVATSHDVRTSLNWLSRACDRSTTACSRVSVAVGPDARWMRRSDGPRVDFTRGRPARLILQRLVETRVAAPGTALSMQQLIQAGWPGERIREQAAQNRVYVTLTRLRKVGLAGVLVHRDDGFLLDPRSAIEQVAEL